MTEDEMVGWHHHFSEHELGQTPGTDEGLGGLASMGSQRIGHDYVTWNNRLIPNRKRSTSRLYIVTLLI